MGVPFLRRWKFLTGALRRRQLVVDSAISKSFSPAVTHSPGLRFVMATRRPLSGARIVRLARRWRAEVSSFWIFFSPASA